jgi:hypothetical protein
MRRVVLESPYAAGTGLRGLIGRWQNRRYARRCLRDSLLKDEAPLASHLLYTQRGVLRDSDGIERWRGITAGLAWMPMAEATVVYVDRGISSGMRKGIEAAKEAGRKVEYRRIEKGGSTAALPEFVVQPD